MNNKETTGIELFNGIINELTELIEKLPDNGGIYAKRAQIWTKLKEWDNVIEDCDMALNKVLDGVGGLSARQIRTNALKQLDMTVEIDAVYGSSI